MKLVKILNEIYDKKLVGSHVGEGGQHEIYNYGNDKVIKFPFYGDIGNNVKIFAKYPNIFPEVYDIEKEYAILEKLDDRKSQKEIYQIKLKLFSKNNNSISSEEKPNHKYIEKLTRTLRNNDSVWYNSNFTSMLYNNLEDNNLFNALKQILPTNLYNIVINNYVPLLKEVKKLAWDSKHKKDINDENFGYNKIGKLKILDI